MQFPYGISNFRDIATNDYFYVDRTDRIPLLERGKYQLFIRPRRFGKSLLLSTLYSYYDLASAHLFDELFGPLAIGRNPTPLRNSYFMLQLDFSCVAPKGTVEQNKQALHDHVNHCIKEFLQRYLEFGINDVHINPENAISSLHSLVSSVHATGHPLFLLIDEYDYTANEIMISALKDTRRRNEALAFEEGPLSTLFKAMKSLAGQGLIDRIFITGASPLVMNDIACGFNIAENISLHHQFNDLCGFTEEEVTLGMEQVGDARGLDADVRSRALAMIRTWYNGYLFTMDQGVTLFHPTMVLHFFQIMILEGDFSRTMLDPNPATDQAELEFLAQIVSGRQIMLDIMAEGGQVRVEYLAMRFRMRDMFEHQRKDYAFMASLLYYFGVLSLEGWTDQGSLALRTPNLLMRKLYLERIAICSRRPPCAAADRDDVR